MITALDKNTALILIDLQKGVAGYPMIHQFEDIVANSAKLIAAFRKKGLPIVIVNVNAEGAAWTKVRKEPAAAPAVSPGEDWLEIVAEIQTQPGDIFITKHTWGAFYETGLHDELKKIGVTGIVLGGVLTSIGVESTARQASELAYNLTFATDAMTDIAVSAHEHSLKIIFPRIGELGTTDEVIAQL